MRITPRQVSAIINAAKLPYPDTRDAILTNPFAPKADRERFGIRIVETVEAVRLGKAIRTILGADGAAEMMADMGERIDDFGERYVTFGGVTVG